MLSLEGLHLQRAGFSLQADWSLPAASRVAVIGPSGAGKSTLLGLIAGFVAPEAGRIVLAGHDITQTAPDQRDMAMLFQDGNLFPGLSLLQNVGLGLRPALRLTASEREAARAALARVGLADQADRRPGDVSGGQQSRAALARVLLQRRAWLLLDEPFAALGPALRQDMLALVEEVLDETGAGLLMVTHDPKDALNVAREVVFVDEGCANSPQSVQDALSNPPPAMQRYLG